ncbi:MAG: hypothetical protein ACLP9Y_11975 [Mycobacterium sp.]
MNRWPVKWWDESEVRAVKLGLRDKITNVCAEIDRRHGNPAGTAERGVYFWLWPWSESIAIDTLQNLLNDARVYLATGRFPPPPVPASAACQHPPVSRRTTRPRRQRRSTTSA